MKKLLSFALFGAILFSTAVFASIPVKKTDGEQTYTSVEGFSLESIAETIQSDEFEGMEVAESAQDFSSESSSSLLDEKWLLVILWFFLGGLAAHRWYAGKPVGWNILFILTAGGCGIWAIVDLVNILTDNF